MSIVKSSINHETLAETHARQLASLNALTDKAKADGYLNVPLDWWKADQKQTVRGKR